ncbi:uncharacterized protein [Nicotiana tomentosiformis]|uniref:uncharacterized protein n=1 Tax=Nicotiana tomentosiformis TaxID=4098 RepID=UPI00087814DD|nr:uncharacterized protein LOC104113816 [Nicotiana tomentosiformis]
MLEDIRIKVMNLLREHEDEVRSWRHDFSPKNMELYSEYTQIAQSTCRVNANRENGYEVSEGSDKHYVNMDVKKCTCRQWDLTGIPCPHVIKAVLHNMGDPLTEMNWWYSKEVYLLTYKHKPQPVRGEIFWKIDPSQAMEPPELVKLAGRPKVKRDRQKDEAIKRKGLWSQSRKGRGMTCSKCGETTHNARTCGHQPKGKGKQQTKRPRTLIDEETEEEINCSTPLISQSTQDSDFRFMPGPGVRSIGQSSKDLEIDQDVVLRPRVISEVNTRLKMR